jgi:N-acetylgalactosamine kinase
MYFYMWFQLKMTKLEIASLSAKSERYIGTEGGGMDQAIAFLGTKGL